MRTVNLNEPVIINHENEFYRFWEFYDKKVGKKLTIKAWNKIKYEDISAILLHVPKYVAATPDIRFRKDPATYLNQECWFDQLIDQRGNNDSQEKRMVL